VGGAGSAGAFLKAFEMHNSRFKLVQVPGHSSTEVASAINDLGQMAAYSSDGLTQYGYLEGSGRPKRLMVPGADATRAQGINNGGVVVGVYFVGGNCYGFAYRNGKYLSFNYPGALCTGAEAINTSGQIVGQYTLDYERYHGFVTQLPTSMFKD
jgi:probable HAF family extracellular repeat protein